jgi:hypothetical protein
LQKKEVGRKSDNKMEQYGRQTVAGLMIKINSQKHGYVSRCCGRNFSKKV